jgi:hypothetical protein
MHRMRGHGAISDGASLGHIVSGVRRSAVAPDKVVSFAKTGAAPDTSSPCNPARVGVRRFTTRFSPRLPRSRARSSREPVV